MRLVPLLLGLLLCIAPGARALEFGINTRHPAELNAQVAELMKERNFRSARIDLLAGHDLGPLVDMAMRVRANGGNVQAVLQTSYQWDHGCNPDLARVEQDAYRQAAAAVDKVKHVVHDFELLNEMQLRPEILREVPWNTAGASAEPYQGKPCLATLARAVRGMSRAVADQRERSGLPLRVILGVVGRDFGFLRFMRDQGVEWDVTGFHVYPHQHSRTFATDPWYGPGGPLAQLASFGKPVHINEFNCGETYDPPYENRAGAPRTETCLRSIARHLRSLEGQDIARLEAIHFYELFDEPRKPAPENRFGLVHELGRPKPHLFLATAFAGGRLADEERRALTSRQLLSDEEIAARRARRAPASTGPSRAP